MDKLTSEDYDAADRGARLAFDTLGLNAATAAAALMTGGCDQALAERLVGAALADGDQGVATVNGIIIGLYLHRIRAISDGPAGK